MSKYVWTERDYELWTEFCKYMYHYYQENNEYKSANFYKARFFNAKHEAREHGYILNITWN